MEFEDLELDNEMQTAWMTYNYKDEVIMYIINTTFIDSAWGMDMEDEVVDKYIIKKENVVITVKEYKTPESSTLRYSAKYKFNGLEYFLFGSMEKAEFENIVKSLFF